MKKEELQQALLRQPGNELAVDEAGTIIAISRGFARMLGHRAVSELLGRPALSLSVNPAHSRAQFERARGDGISADTVLRHRTGRRVLVHYRSRVETLDDGTVATIGDLDELTHPTIRLFRQLVADYTGVSPSTVDRAKTEGALPFHRTRGDRGRPYFLLGDVNAWSRRRDGNGRDEVT